MLHIIDPAKRSGVATHFPAPMTERNYDHVPGTTSESGDTVPDNDSTADNKPTPVTAVTNPGNIVSSSGVTNNVGAVSINGVTTNNAGASVNGVTNDVGAAVSVSGVTKNDAAIVKGASKSVASPSNVSSSANEKKSSSASKEQKSDAQVAVKTREVDNDSFLMPQIRPKSSVQEKPPKFGRITKFRHLKGTPLHKSQHFENLKGLSKSTPAETDIIQVCSDWSIF